jgi:tripartite-type tricarboxylate transporter receptor subunit TctC
MRSNHLSCHARMLVRFFTTLAFASAIATSTLAQQLNPQTTPTPTPAYPARPVRVVVPVAAAGPTDVFARLITQKLSENLARQFYVENIGGAGGNIGVGQAAKAVPDGYTILIVSNLFVVNPSLYDKVPYDPYKDFDPVTLAADFTNVITVHPSLPVKTVRELVDFVGANPGKYSYTSGGIGTTPHLMAEQMRLSLGLDLVHVPFNSGGLAIGSAVAGHTPISFGGLPPAAPLVREGKLRALAVSGRTRSLALPDVPTLAEAGFPNIKGDAWIGILVPAGTPKDIVGLLNHHVVSVIALPEIEERFAALGYQPIASTVEEFAKQIHLDIEKWAAVIRAAQIKVR